MDLDFTPEQELLRTAVRGACERHGGLDTVRKLEDDPVGYTEPFWAELSRLGIVGMLVPEERGGSGMSLLDAAIVYEELGRALVPSPHFVSSVLAAGLITRVGTPEQQALWLPQLAAGDAIVTVAATEPSRRFGPAGVALHAEPDGDGWWLTGTKVHVPFARSASALLVVARVDDGRGPEGVGLFLVDPDADGVTLTQHLTIASDTQYRVALDHVRVGPGDVVGTPGDAWRAWDDAMHVGIVLLAALAVGGARATLELTVQYAKDRRQFDKPLGAFQSIAHYLSDAVTAVDGAETLTWEAAWAGSEGRSLARLAPMAKLFACRTYRSVTATAQQVFGGIGFTVDCDVQLYFRRAKQLQLSWWDDRHLEELVAAQILDG